MSAKGQIRLSVTVCDSSTLATCYAELNGRVGPEPDSIWHFALPYTIFIHFYLLEMTASDPIQTARTLIRLGLTREALTTLERASVQYPERTDINKAIAELRYATSAAGRAWLIFDLTIIWVLLLGTGTLLGWLGYQGGLALTRWWTPPEVSWMAPAMFGAVIVGSYAYARIWIFLFLHIWFCYLKYLSRANRHQVEMRLPSYFRVQSMEPQYSQLRRRYFSEQA